MRTTVAALGANVDEGRQAAFDRLWSAQGAALARVVASFARPGADQDDLTQEIALALWQALPRFRGESSEKTFALRVAHNRALSHAWKRRTDEPLDDDLPATAQAPDEAAEAQQDADRLFAQIRRLPMLQREVITLALEDLSHDEIGTMLGITPGNVAVRLTRARAQLRGLMNGGGS